MIPRQFLFPLLILVTLGLALSPSGYRRVQYVYDGDTILLDGGDRVRYLGIDAPEMDHEGGKSEFLAAKATALNRKLVSGAPLRLEYDQDRTDHYGRILAYVFLPAGEMVNAHLV